MPPVEFVFFDLDDTLLDHRRAERQALHDLFRQFGAAFSDCTAEALCAFYHAHNTTLWDRYGRGEITKETLKRIRFEHVAERFDVRGVDAQALGAYYLARYAEHWCAVEGALAAFEHVAALCPVGILTNGFAELQQAKMQRFPALRHGLPRLVISEEVGYLKPHPRLFAHAARLAGVPAPAILYVGDSFASDVEGARAAGWQAAWFTRGQADAPDGVFCFDRWDAFLDYPGGFDRREIAGRRGEPA